MIGATSASAATGGTTGDCTWTLDGTVLTISDNGNMGYHDPNRPWGTSIRQVNIEDCVTPLAILPSTNASPLRA